MFPDLHRKTFVSIGEPNHNVSTKSKDTQKIIIKWIYKVLRFYFPFPYLSLLFISNVRTKPTTGYMLLWAASPGHLNRCSWDNRITFLMVVVFFFSDVADDQFIKDWAWQGALSVAPAAVVSVLSVLSVDNNQLSYHINSCFPATGFHSSRPFKHPTDQRPHDRVPIQSSLCHKARPSLLNVRSPCIQGRDKSYFKSTYCDIWVNSHKNTQFPLFHISVSKFFHKSSLDYQSVSSKQPHCLNLVHRPEKTHCEIWKIRVWRALWWDGGGAGLNFCFSRTYWENPSYGIRSLKG